jgi:hypothetical protein
MRSIMAEAMRSRRLRACAVAALLALAGTGASAADPLAPEDASAAAASDAAVASSPSAAPSAAAQPIQDTVDALRKDPLLSGKHKVHRIKFGDDKAEKKAEEPDTPIAWLRDFLRFLNDTSRLLVYGLALVLAAFAIVSARHFVHLRADRRRLRDAAAVSHVRDLDVRPESLPDDVGGAAWTLWQAGDAAAALSLLYRGALSRLIHRHGVPIVASTTEGECLALTRGRLEPAAHRYLTQLVLAREAVTYGQRVLSAAQGETLCSAFAGGFDSAAPAPAEEAR